MTLTSGRVRSSETWRLEQFARAYVQAVASAANCSMSIPSVDDDSIDLSLRRRTLHTLCRSPQLDVQLKATSANSLLEDYLAYPLPRKNYDDLRSPDVLVPRILVVVLMNENVEDWLIHSEASLALRRCGYWLSIRDFPETSNTASCTVRIPRAQAFNAEELDRIFVSLENGRVP
jgi:hypothetical protein